MLTTEPLFFDQSDISNVEFFFQFLQMLFLPIVKFSVNSVVLFDVCLSWFTCHDLPFKAV